MSESRYARAHGDGHGQCRMFSLKLPLKLIALKSAPGRMTLR